MVTLFLSKEGRVTSSAEGKKKVYCAPVFTDFKVECDVYAVLQSGEDPPPTGIRSLELIQCET